MGTPAVGYQGKLGISASNPVDAAFEFTSESLRKTGANIEHDGIAGTRSHRSERIRANNYTVGGQIAMQPCPEELAALLPCILGAVASGTTFALAETIPERYITIDRGTKVFTYDGCKVARATFSASEGSPLTLELDIVGKTETVANSGTFPAITVTNAPPFMFYDGVSSIASTAYAFKSFRLTIDNNLMVAYNNSQSASHIVAADRMVSLEVTTPYSSDETALLDAAVAGLATTFTFTNGGYSCAFALAKWQFPTLTPTINSKTGETVLQLSGAARMLSTTRELIVTLDSTA
jgi:hypothetical protein